MTVPWGTNTYNAAVKWPADNLGQTYQRHAVRPFIKFAEMHPLLTRFVAVASFGQNAPHVRPAEKTSLPHNQPGDDPGEHSHDDVAREYNRNEKPPPKLRTSVGGRPGPMVLCERPPLMLLLITRGQL